MMHTVIAMMGLPRSGKTTLAREISRQTGYPIVSPDAVRLVIHGHRYYAPCEDLVWAHVKVMICALMSAGHHTVILDATHTTLSSRDSVRRWGRDSDTSFRVLFCPTVTPQHTCVQRAKDTGMPDLIPVIATMADNFQPLQSHERTYGDS